MESVEFAIIGGGVHGASVGYHLARAGADVRLFDRGAPAGGPTGRSSAVCRCHYTNPFLAAVAARSQEMFRNFSEVSGGRDAGFHTTGLLYLHPPGDRDAVRDTQRLLGREGVRLEVLEPDALGDAHPDWSLEGVGVGVWEPAAGYADPVLTTQALFARGVELGLKYRLYAGITRLAAAPSGGALLTLEDGSVTRCSRLLVAAGPWTRALVAQLGVDLPLTVERHAVGAFGWGGAPHLPFAVADLVGDFYGRPDGEEIFIVGSLGAGSTVDADDFNQGLTHIETLEFADGLVNRIPAMAMADTRGGWAGLYDMSPDTQPVIGEVEDGIFVDAGTSGHGFKLAPALGECIAQLLRDEDVPGLADFHPRRFEQQQPLAAGYGRARILG
jgi:glycine/D-amino acid oxidase-like deaminating enzyme